MNPSSTQQYLQVDAHAKKIILQGEWNLYQVADFKKAIKKISIPSGIYSLDARHVKHLDTAGAWVLKKWCKQLEDRGVTLHDQQFTEQQKTLFDLIESQTSDKFKFPKRKLPNVVARLGKNYIAQWENVFQYLAFIGELTLEVLRLIARPKKIRWGAFVSVIDKTGYRALPIIALLSFMVGVVMTYQMGLQLQKFGANVFIVDLLGLSVLREFGPLITAIMVAGRSGSAFTAELGIMKINQEIDALTTMGVTPSDLLLLPKIFGLLIALPLLTMWADIFGVLGGILMSSNMFDIGVYDFLQRFQREIPLRALLIGLGKAPVFALIIASVGCFQGMQVHRSAESVGKLTTRSVVLSIFFIIVADAVFSIMFSKFKL